MNKTRLKELIYSLTEEEAKDKLSKVALWALEMSECTHHLCSSHESINEEVTSFRIFKLLGIKVEHGKS